MSCAALILTTGTSSKKTGLLHGRYREVTLMQVPENQRGLVRTLQQVLSIDTDGTIPDVPLSGNPEVDKVELVRRLKLHLPPKGQLAAEPAMVAHLELPDDHMNLSSPQVAARGCPRIAASYMRRERRRVFNAIKVALEQVFRATRLAVAVAPVHLDTVHVVILGGPGGTAGGSMRMACRLVVEAAEKLGVRDRVLISVFIVTSGAESAVNGDRARSNTYAQIMELYADSQSGRQVFDWLFVVGPKDGRGRVVSWDETWQILAQVIHLLLCTPAGPAIVGRLGDAEPLRLGHDPQTGTGKVLSTVGFSQLYLPDLAVYFGSRLACIVLDRHLEGALARGVAEEQARRNLRQVELLPAGRRPSGVRRRLLDHVDDQQVHRGLLDLVDQAHQQVEGQGLPVETAVHLRPSMLSQAVERCREIVEENELRLSEELVWSLNGRMLRPLEQGDHGLIEACAVVEEMIAATRTRAGNLQEHLETRDEKRTEGGYRARTLRERLVSVLNGDFGNLVRQLGTQRLNRATSEAERAYARSEVEVLALEAELRLLEDVEAHLTSSLALLEGLKARYEEARGTLQDQVEQELGRSHAFDFVSGVDLGGNPGDFDLLYDRFLVAASEDEAVEQVLRQFGGLPPSDVEALRRSCEAKFRVGGNVQEEFTARYPEARRRQENLENLAELSRELLEVHECRVDLPHESHNPTARMTFVCLAGGDQAPLAADLRRILEQDGANVYLLDHGHERTVDILTVRVGLPPTALPILETCRESYTRTLREDLRKGAVLSHTGKLEHLLLEPLPWQESLDRSMAMGFALGTVYQNGRYRLKTGTDEVDLGATPQEAQSALRTRHGALAAAAAEFVDRAREPGGQKALVQQLLQVGQQQSWLAAPVQALAWELKP